MDGVCEGGGGDVEAGYGLSRGIWGGEGGGFFGLGARG